MIVVLSIQSSKISWIWEWKRSMQFKFWHMKYFSMFQSPIFGNIVHWPWVYLLYLFGHCGESEPWRILKWQMLVLLYLVGPSAVIEYEWICAEGIFVCETNSKMEFFTEHNTHKIHFCDAATLKFQEKYQALLFLSTARRMMCSVLYFSPIIPVCLPGRAWQWTHLFVL